MRRRQRFFILVLVSGALLLLAAAGSHLQPTLLEKVQSRGELVVAAPGTMVDEGQTGNIEAGLELDLLWALADSLGVELRLLAVRNPSQGFEALASGAADLGTAELSTAVSRYTGFRYTRPFLEVESVLVHRQDTIAPDTLEELRQTEKTLAVAANSAQAALLRRLYGEEDPFWTELERHPSDILYQVWRGAFDYTITDRTNLQRNQRYLPELRDAMPLGEPLKLSWVFLDGEDLSLFRHAQTLLGTTASDGRLDAKLERHFGHLGEFDYVNIRTFLRHITSRLPEYRPLFKEAAETYNLDWRLLAAIGYQESLWDPGAVSHTGVRGLMMLTSATANQMGVDRLDPAESITGGARYMRHLLDLIPGEIEEPVRTWLALAAYNVGLGHLQDARQLTERLGGNPNAWQDIKEHLPLLSDPEWYVQTRHGQARGREPVIYVSRVRSYHELLLRITDTGEAGTPGPRETPVTPYAGSNHHGPQLGGALEAVF